MPLRFSRIGRWWHKDCEIDIVAFASAADAYLLGECKWREEGVSLSVLRELQAKASRQGFEPVGWYLFSKGEFTDSLVETAREMGNIYLLDAQRIAAD